MTRIAAPALAALVVVALVLALPTALATGGPVDAAGSVDAQATDRSVATNATDLPGVRLSGIIGVQAAEVEGEIETRSFGIAFRAAHSNASKATVVASQFDSLESRLAELRDRSEALQERRANGSISEGRYRAEMAQVAARTATLTRLSNQTQAATTRLPRDVLEANGVNVTAIETLQQAAATLSGPEVAEIARSIAGNQVGVGIGANATTGPPAEVPGAANATKNTTGGGPPDDVPGRNEQAGNSSASWVQQSINTVASIIT